MLLGRPASPHCPLFNTDASLIFSAARHGFLVFPLSGRGARRAWPRRASRQLLRRRLVLWQN
ncbi:hypothetical protein BGLA2_1390051 [Burkholderia gladioli]|nr:hypothetical protein BGLA2_1390051 [Burkholderia gladioli]